MDKTIFLIDKLRRIGHSDFILLPKSEFKKIKHKSYYRIEIRIVEVENNV